MPVSDLYLYGCILSIVLLILNFKEVLEFISKFVKNGIIKVIIVLVIPFFSWISVVCIIFKILII